MVRSRIVVALFLTALATLLAPAPVRGAALREMSVIAYGPARGLSGHPVTALAQDGLGRLWVGTFGGGVFCYDGVVWRQITSRQGLLSDRVTFLIAGARGEVWVSTSAAAGTRGGLAIVQEDRVLPPIEGEGWEATTGLEAADGTVWLARRTGGIARFRADVLEPLPDLDGVAVRRIVAAPDGLWFLGRPLAGGGDAAGTLHRYDGTSFRSFGAGDGLPAAPFHSLLADRAGRLWVGTARGLFVLSGSRFEVPSLSGASCERAIRTLSEDAEGRLWLGTDGAVLRVDKDSVAELKLPQELGPVPVLAAESSPSGGVFLVTPSHLLRLEGESIEVLALEERRTILPPGEPAEALRLEAALDGALEQNRILLIDHEGGAWAVNGRQVVRYAGDEARRYGRDEGLPSDDVRTVHVDSRGRVWAGTAAGAARLLPERGFFEPVLGAVDAVTALYEDRGGAVYAATARGVLRIDDLAASPWAPAAGLPRTNAIVADGGGRLWLGTEAGVVRSSPEGLLAFTSDHGLAPGPVLALALIDGDLWSAHASGVSHYTGTRFESVTALEGIRVLGLVASGSREPPRLLAVTATGLLAVPGGKPVPPLLTRTGLHAAHRSAAGVLWLGTDLGLLKWEDGAEVLHSGGAFPADPVRAFAEEADGRIWFATARGLYRHAPRRRPPSVWIDQALVGGRPQPLDRPIAAGGGCGEVFLRFGGVSFVGPRDGGDLRFETRITPHAPEWTPPSFARERVIAGLRPGRARLEVRAVSRDLLRSEPVAIDLVIGGPGEMPGGDKLVLPPIARP